jgi:hypothetical protein
MARNQNQAIREGGRAANLGQRDSTDLAQASGQGSRRTAGRQEESQKTSPRGGASGRQRSPGQKNRKSAK